jgi:uncharacterized delta-60 repeat protein
MKIRFTGILLVLFSYASSIAQINSTCAGFGSNGFASSLESHSTHLSAVTVLSNGKIVAVGHYDDNTDTDFLVARYNADGTPDLTFSVNGIRVYDVSDGFDDKALCVAVASDGNILVGGISHGYGAMIKIDADGDLHNAFGESGVVQYDLLYSSIETILVASNGNIFAAGKTINSANIVILRMQVKAFTSGGDPLTSFSEDGEYDDPEFLVWHESVIRASLQSDGKIVVAGTTFGASELIDRWSLQRLNVDGSVDASFGGDGQVDEPETSKSEIRDIVITADGSIYVGGFSSADDDTSFGVGKKFKPNGDTDNSFNMNGSAIHLLTGGYSKINAIAIDDTGNMFVVGSGSDDPAAQDLILAAFDSGGEPDGDFGVHNDKVTGSTHGALTDVVRLSDGSFITCGSAIAGGITHGVLRKHKADGTVLSTFNDGGNSMIRFIEDGETYSVILQPDGKLVIGGVYLQDGSNTGLVFARFLANGEPDVTFGTFGFIRYDVSTRREFLRQMVLLPDGKILAAGIINGGVSNNDFLIMKLNADGSVDEEFGVGGYFKKHYGAYAKSNELSQITVDNEGRILIAGDANYNGGSYQDATLMRVLPNGTVDTDFADEGVFRKQLTVVNDYFTDVVVAPDGSIFVAGHGTVNAGAAVMKLNNAGEVDTEFGTDGIIHIDWSEEEITRAMDILIQPDGKVLVSCTRRNPSDVFAGSAFLYRINADGTADESFGEQGFADLSIFGQKEAPEGLILNEDGSIYVWGQYQPSGGNNVFLVKMNADGSEAHPPYVNDQFRTQSNIVLNPLTGSLYAGVTPDGLGGMHVVCLGTDSGGGGGGECDGIPVPSITHDGDVLVASDGDSFEWYKNGELLDGETGQTLAIDPVIGGTFTVSVTVGSCTQSSDDYDYFVTSVVPREMNATRIYPNPFSERISVRSSQDLSGSVITLYSVTGIVLQQAQGVKEGDAILDVRHLSAGAYILSVESPKGRINVKLIKHH